MSIRPGWFYHSAEDSLVKTPKALFEIYLKSFGRGSNLLLNVPADRSGLISAYDSAALMGFARLREESFHSSLIKKDNAEILLNKKNVTESLTDENENTWITLGNDYATDFLEIRFTKIQSVNCMLLKEPLQNGQRVNSFTIELWNGNQLLYRLEQTTIGHQRMLTFPVQTVTRIRIKITGAKSDPMISEVGVYQIDEQLVEK